MSLPIPAELIMHSSLPWSASTAPQRIYARRIMVSFTDRSAAITVAPSLTIRCAVVAPIPDKPPATTAIR